MDGYGSFQSYLNWKIQSSKYRFDLVIYVFNENDIGDNISGSGRRKYIPTAVFSNMEPGFKTNPKFTTRIDKILKKDKISIRYLKGYSLAMYYLFNLFNKKNPKSYTCKLSFSKYRKKPTELDITKFG